MNTFITNNKTIFEKILNNFYLTFENFNIKNLNIETLKNLKIKINKNFLYLKNICFIKNIKEKEFQLIFENDIELKNLIKTKFFENFGFQILKKKNSINLIIPNLSLEFRNKIINIVKNEFFSHKEKLENNKKQIFLKIKNNYKSKDEIFFLEQAIKKELIFVKIKLEKMYEKIKSNILND